MILECNVNDNDHNDDDDDDRKQQQYQEPGTYIELNHELNQWLQ